ncbi:two component transcriptional regulator, AraC family [Pelagirhabdus alkalitolerans]|uniref:Two component transcriptional regulator, AraC family n=1 Tax=Pelagirhabdus alkalitolerans TaxID=1612202 RepID=A0A1G6KY65_9BACI|nr:response regulator transcription factor [Pelagirhabdus alkalitolerans]SDC35415.1 two component transcriptional regulator, AraC family [Pelagirhabdus alkalitolerans]
MTNLINVLVVDDELLIRQGIMHYLNWEEHGFQVVGEASNGEEALQLMEETSVDIVITDIVMPVMSGTDFIHEVRSRYPDIFVIVLSSHGDYDYVRETFQSGVTDYILKPNLNETNLLTALNRAIGKQDQTKTRSKPQNKDYQAQLKKIITGYALPIEEKEALSKQFIYPAFALVHIDHDSTIEKTMVEQLAYEYNDLTWFQINLTDHSRELLINTTEEAFVDFLDQLKQVNENKDETRYLFSRLFYSIDDLKEINQTDIHNLKNHAFYLANQNYLYAGDFVENDEMEAFDLNYFTEALKHKKFESAFYVLDKYMKQVEMHHSMDPNELKGFLGNIIFNVTVILDMLDYEVEAFEQDKYRYFNLINHATNFQEATTYLNQFIDAIKELIETELSSLKNSNIDQLLAYIDNHYHESLSLTALSEHFHFNPSYLSSYFRQHKEVGFSDYLTQVRIAKAKELLKDDTFTIAEVGSMVGYSDHSYFCKVFKKQTNQSPSRYRKHVNL